MSKSQELTATDILKRRMFKVAIGRRQNQKFVSRVGWKLFCNTFGLNLASIVAKYSENLCGNTLTRITLTSTKEVISILLNSAYRFG